MMEAKEWIERERKANAEVAAFIEEQAAAAERAKVVAMLEQGIRDYRRLGNDAAAKTLEIETRAIKNGAHHEGGR